VIANNAKIANNIA